MRSVITTLCCLLICNHLVAQESCVEILFKANQHYEKGQLNEAIEMAGGCTREENSASERWQAFRLLTMAYIAAGENKKARKSAEQMLDINPEYTASKVKDPVELINLLKTITIIPKFTLGLATTIGGNLTFVDLVGTYNGAEYQKKYTSKGSWQIGLTTGYNWNKVISLQSGLIVSSKRFDIEYAVSNWDIKLEEQLTYMTVPLVARFMTKEEIKSIRFFADAGGFIGFLTSASTDITRKNKVDQVEVSEINLNAFERRKALDYGVLYGVGATKKVSQFNIALEVRYYLSYANITNVENRYKNSKLFYGFYFIDDDVRLDNLSISFSAIYNLNYKVIKSK